MEKKESKGFSTIEKSQGFAIGLGENPGTLMSGSGEEKIERRIRGGEERDREKSMWKKKKNTAIDPTQRRKFQLLDKRGWKQLSGKKGRKKGEKQKKIEGG